MSAVRDGQKEADFVSSLPDYAQVFMFLRKFRAILPFPSVSLSDLADFFVTGHNDLENVVVSIHWKLLTSVTRRDSRKDWKKMATRFAFRSGIINDVIPYCDIPVEKRVKILKLSCEGQFDYNLPFRAELKKLELTSDTPVGTDSSGHRYWLLQDGSFNCRLYKETGYDVLPPLTSSWSTIARSIDELDDCIAKLDASKTDGKEDEEMEVINDSGLILEPQGQSDVRRKPGTGTRRQGEKGGGEEEEEEGGCMVCGMDNDYQNMLLCDYCDNECHMYCLYPKLWTVPRGKWSCPQCNERELVQRLKEAHSSLAMARYNHKKATERKQRNVIRLQKSGLLLQNIILSDSSTERTRRVRKVVNYAELNDVYLPPLGPKDFVVSGSQSSNAESTARSTHYVNTRSSRRLRGEPEQCSVNMSQGRYDPDDRLADTPALARNPPPSFGDKMNQVATDGSKDDDFGGISVTVDQHRHSSSGSALFESNAASAFREPQQPGGELNKPSLAGDEKLPVWNGSMTASSSSSIVASSTAGEHLDPTTSDMDNTPLDCA